MPLLSSCKASPKNNDTVVIYRAPDLYHPPFPAPKEGVIVPLNENYSAVKDDKEVVSYVLMPNWYFKLWTKWSVEMCSYAELMEQYQEKE